MDVNKEVSVDVILLPLRLKKLKNPIVALLNEYEFDDGIDYDVFERSGSGICTMVDVPVNLAKLHSSLEDLIRVTEIASLKYEFGRDAFRLSVHLFYRIILKENNYYYRDFILYYEQYNKSWMKFSEDYHKTYEEWQFSVNLKEKEEINLQYEKPSRFELSGVKRPLSNVLTSVGVGEQVSWKDQSVQSWQIIQSEAASCSRPSNPFLKNRKRRIDDALTLGIKELNMTKMLKPSDRDKNKKCFYIDKNGVPVECAHSQIVIYQLFKTGDYLRSTEDDDDDHRQCPCYRMKCSVIRKIHPLFIDLAWQRKHLSMFKHWCFINCSITFESLQMLKTIHPWIECLKEGFLVPYSLTDLKRISLRTFALKSLICNYVNVPKLDIQKRLKV